MTVTKTLHNLGYVSSRGVVENSAGEPFPIYDPALGTLLAQAREVTVAELDDVVVEAKSVYQGTWRHLDGSDRGRLLSAWADLIEKNRYALADLEVADVGHVRSEALGDIDQCARSLRYYGGMADKVEGRSFANVPGRLSYGLEEPYGVVAAINPYNGNGAFIGMKVGAALAAGNCIVLKAAEVAPLLHFRLGELALEAGLPAGVVNVVTGRGHRIGPLLMEHPDVGMVAFTGGPNAGRSVIRQSAQNFTPLVLELGGKSPVVLLPDADLEVAIPSVLHSNLAKSGQSCVAGSRVLVHESIYERVCEEFAARAKSVRVGLPADPKSQMGTLISREHREGVHELVENAMASGAALLAGGKPVDRGELVNGAFYEPTVLADVTDDNPVAYTEAFGPVASLMPYSTVDEALARANASRFGLSAQIWGKSVEPIQYLAQNIVAGSVWVNTYRAIHPTVPYGGMNESGYGREGGFEGMRMYTRQKSVTWDLREDRELPYA